VENRIKILIAHNAYQLRGGEDSVVDAESALLQSSGHSIAKYVRHNNDIPQKSRLVLAQQTLWSPQTTSELADLIHIFRPNVIHIHNTFPLISPSLYWAAARAGVPVVQTLHNFRLACPQAMFLRRGKVCEDCLGKIPWRGVWHGCYRDSRLQSAVLAGMLTVHRAIHTWDTKVTRYVALNNFCRDKFIAAGLPPERIVVKPNFVDFPAPEVGERNGFLFVGRLSTEKGIEVLARAMAALDGAALRVAGTGPESHRLAGVAGLVRLGALTGDNIRLEMTAAAALILPSIWYENFPRTLVEAFACGLPVIASRIGALAELVQDGVTGLLFEPGDADDLADKMRWALQHPEQMAQMGRNARRQYEAEFTAERNYQQLMAIYADAIAEVKAKAP
jgi:glycosyltransferase involved in cell wall biosynthesis